VVSVVHRPVVFFALAAALLCLTGGATARQPKAMLLVIDMQSALLQAGKGGLHVDSVLTLDLVKKTNQSIHAAVSTGMLVAYTMNEWTNPLENTFTHNVCKKGLPGTAIDSRIDVVDSLIFHKSISNALSNRRLLQFIRANGITRIYLSGIMAEGCVQSTARSSVKNGFETFLIVPAIGSSSRSKLKFNIDKLKKLGVRTVDGIE
jgi:nicotinamidase-related amidase